MPSVACETTPGMRILPSGSFTRLPDRVFVLVPRIGGFDQIGLRPHPQHQIDQLVELDVEGVRPVPAAPAQVIANALLRQAAQARD